MKKLLILVLVILSAKISLAQYDISFGTPYQLPPANSDPKKFRVTIILTNTSSMPQPGRRVFIAADHAKDDQHFNTLELEDVQSAGPVNYVVNRHGTDFYEFITDPAEVLQPGSRQVFTATAYHVDGLSPDPSDWQSIINVTVAYLDGDNQGQIITDKFVDIDQDNSPLLDARLTVTRVSGPTPNPVSTGDDIQYSFSFINNDPNLISAGNYSLEVTASNVNITSVSNPGEAYFNPAVTVGNVYTFTGKNVDVPPNGISLFTVTGKAVNSAPNSRFTVILKDNAGNVVQSLESDFVLPVTFGEITAAYRDGLLNVNWQTIKELNNKEFEIQGSLDGLSFQSLGTVISKAHNGSSDIALEYSFSSSIKEVTERMGVLPFVGAAFLLSFLFYGFQKRRLLFLGVASSVVLATVFIACQKTDASIESEMPKLWVRIAQKDIDGKVSYSKVIKVTAE